MEGTDFMNLHIETINENIQTVLKLIGEIDVYTAPNLKEILLDLLSHSDARVVVDMKNVSYMDSTGLGVFISALKKCQEKGSSFKIINLQERVYRLFDITGLKEVMTIEEISRGVNE